MNIEIDSPEAVRDVAPVGRGGDQRTASGDRPHGEINVATPRVCGDFHQISVLHDPIFRARIDGQDVRRTLPGLLSAISSDCIESITGVRTHHAHMVHMFLAQLVSMTAIDSGDETAWRKALLSIEPDEQAWRVFPRKGDHGFFQPAILGDLKAEPVTDPTGFDMLFYGRNHSLKSDAIGAAELDSWIWAIVAIQTCGGYLLKNRTAVFRINSGIGSRAFWAVYDRSWGLGMRIIEDAKLIRDRHPSVAADFGFAADGGLKLMWTRAWTDPEMLRASDLDPSVLEVCWRVNLCADAEGRISGLRSASNSFRTLLSNKDSEQYMRGNCGDIWSPVLTDGKGQKSYTIDARGLPYDVIANNAMGIPYGANTDVRPSPASRRQVADPVLIVAGIATANGKTEGFFQRQLPFGQAGGGSFFFDGPELGEVGRQMVLEAKHAQSAVRRGLTAFQGGDVKDAVGDRFIGLVSKGIDQIFFEYLPRLYAEQEGAKAEWIDALHRIGTDAMEAIFAQVPVRGLNRIGQTVKAEKAFHLQFWCNKDLSLRSYLDARNLKNKECEK